MGRPEVLHAAVQVASDRPIVNPIRFLLGPPRRGRIDICLLLCSLLARLSDRLTRRVDGRRPTILDHMRAVEPLLQIIFIELVDLVVEVGELGVHEAALLPLLQLLHILHLNPIKLILQCHIQVI